MATGFETLTKAEIESAIRAITGGAQSYQTPAGTVTRANLDTLVRLHRAYGASQPRRFLMRTRVLDGGL